MRNFVLFLVSMVFALAGGFAAADRSRSGDDLDIQSVTTVDPKADSRGRLLVVLDGPMTSARRDALESHGTIHGTLDRYNAVAITPHGRNGRLAIEQLNFVTMVEEDQPRFPVGVGTWDRDVLDVTDVGPFDPNNPFAEDPREVSPTGEGVHVAVIDTGLIKGWRSVLDAGKVATPLARAFMGGGAVADLDDPRDEFNTSNPTNLWERDTNSHGTAVASHVIGFDFLGAPIDGTAPDATIIPLKVFPNGQAFTFSSRIIAAIRYVTELVENGEIGPTVINMSLGGSAPSVVERTAINDAIDAGIIVVASAGNSGENGMGWPGAFPEVIAVGAAGFNAQFTAPSHWRTIDAGNDPDGSGPVSEEQMVFVATFSARAVEGLGPQFGVEEQELDVVAPGQFTVAPCLLSGVGGGNQTFCFWSGTSFSSPLTAGTAALVKAKNPSLMQADVESILKSTALFMLGDDTRTVPVPIIEGDGAWDSDCDGTPCDPVGAGWLQADDALDATP